MSIESDTEEVNLNYIVKKLEKGFKNLLRVCLSIARFYKKKWILFLVIVIVGSIGGYILDSKFGYSKKYIQEIIIEPKYDSKKYVYDFINSLKSKVKEPSFLKKANLDSTLVKNLRLVEINPIIRSADILDNLHKKYGGKEDYHEIIESYDTKVLEKEKYKNFYKYHRLTFVFNTKDENNLKLSKNILNYIQSNNYFQKILNQEIKQTQKNLKENKETLAYINDYLEKLSKAPNENTNDVIIVGEESELPTISSLLARKQTLLTTITKYEDLLMLDNEVFDMVERGEMITRSAGLSKKMIIRVPIALFLFVSLLFLFQKLPSRLIEYINS
ncbi:hypothetical protein [Aquimarina litoralis]|uniref:hypothetical protein n=1 Tax=Aquimarina litoralis TaxID=584605 RepID=UPI001C56EC57|nr:hypothetical protein [Aquimarina litoralis]MBW1293882.1 hypothetical protein [Aquimarina litoralis]